MIRICPHEDPDETRYVQQFKHGHTLGIFLELAPHNGEPYSPQTKEFGIWGAALSHRRTRDHDCRCCRPLVCHFFEFEMGSIVFPAQKDRYLLEIGPDAISTTWLLFTYGHRHSFYA